MDNIHVQCPECSHEFNAAEQLKLHFKQIVIKDKLLDDQNKKITQLQNDRSSNKEEIERLRAELIDSKKIAKLEVKEEYKDLVKDAYQKGLDKAKLNNSTLRKEAKEAAKVELKDEIEKASERAFQNGMIAAEQKFQDQEETELTNTKIQLSAERLEKKRLQEQIQKLNEKSQQRNVEVQGESAELYLEEMLKEKFPNDEIKDIKKGASGHDCTLIINHRNTEGLAKIAFESKNTKHFSEEWPEKLNKTLMDKKIPYGVIATRALPKNFKHIEWRYDSIVIIPFKESSVLSTAEILKALLIREYEVRKISMLDDSEKGQLYKRLLSPDMRMQVTALMRSYLATQSNIDEDERISAKSIVKRQANLNEQKTKILKIFGAISGTDSKLADNLIFTDEEISKTGNISQLRTIKGPQ